MLAQRNQQRNDLGHGRRERCFFARFCPSKQALVPSGESNRGKSLPAVAKPHLPTS